MRTRSVVALATAFVLALASCGGDDGGDSGPAEDRPLCEELVRVDEGEPITDRDAAAATFDRLVNLAPDEAIGNALAVMRSVALQLYDVADEDARFDLSLELYGDPDVQAAIAEVETFLAERCG